ncbi:MaoC family dehydratase [Aeromonas dhakensis]|uniref:MaoC family dehydratase n=1 Tax=Aeromonas TaxID=642 RepID=UPI0005BBAE69|nr:MULTISPECIES: MaoC family dehydratase [Aeromonas]MDD9306791.1 MaoC family dehydratase [Aeromonas hydrophila]ELM3750811.1 MaoC family dehydratase [Aeromonas dhakensis]MBL0600866.1 MaoC family dehydratase [Aeromonas dhakensis]MBL0620031.1 MaoC family dehydratase [Aeromonas dhakensis]MBL0658365.1 MaoC family dehydratase [Aeromonas dhakensis]
MKVVDFLKRKREILAQHPFELKDWLSPAIRDYWREFQQKAHLHPLLGRVLDLQGDNQSMLQQQGAAQAVNGQPVPPQESIIELDGEAATLFATLQARIGEETHVGEWLHVSQQMIDQFAAVTGDHQWIHTNPERAAAESPFKTTIAHGFLTLALLPQLTGSVDEANPEFPTARMVVNFGLDQVRFPYPIKVDSNIRARTKLARVTPIKGGLELLKEIKVEIEGVRRPGCVIESVTRLYF